MSIEQTDTEAGQQYLTFAVKDLEYAVDILAIQEIRAANTRITPVPRTPEHVRGVINLRGVVVPVYDLRGRFGMEMLDDVRFAVIVVASVGKRVVGLLVDAVSDVVSIQRDRVQSADSLGAATSNELVRGIAHVDERLVVLLDLDAVVAGAESHTEQAVA